MHDAICIHSQEVDFLNQREQLLLVSEMRVKIELVIEVSRSEQIEVNALTE